MGCEVFFVSLVLVCYFPGSVALHTSFTYHTISYLPLDRSSPRGAPLYSSLYLATGRFYTHTYVLPRSAYHLYVHLFCITVY